MTVIPITQAASRRNALRLALGGAAVVAALPASSLEGLPVSDPDKRLRWLGEQLELEYAEFWRATEVYYTYAKAVGDRLDAIYRNADGSTSPQFERRHSLWLAKEQLWSRVEVRTWEITRAPVSTFPGLVVKARAVELAGAGIATARCAALGIPLSEKEIGYWPIGRMLAFVRDVRNVPGTLA